MTASFDHPETPLTILILAEALVRPATLALSTLHASLDIDNLT
jgi:hypothetical protein